MNPDIMNENYNAVTSFVYLVGDILEGAGAIFLGVAALHVLRKYNFGPVSTGLRSTARLLAYSMLALGVAEVVVSLAPFSIFFAYLEPITEGIAGSIIIGTSILVLRFGRGILEVLGAVKNERPSSDASGTGGDGDRSRHSADGSLQRPENEARRTDGPRPAERRP